MKTKFLLMLLTLIFANTVSATTLREGAYIGQIDNGDACGVRIRKDAFISTERRVEFSWKTSSGRYEGGYIVVDQSALQLDGTTFEGEDKNDIAVAKVKIKVAGDGTPISAKMGVGMLVQWGYDETCNNLVPAN